MNHSFTSNLKKKTPRQGEGLYYDPLYGNIPTSIEIRMLMDLEVFQRLRGIKQLSTLYLVFPGAFHTRFEHSVGVCYLARVVHERLKEYISYSIEPEIKEIELNEISLKALEVSALLHDIGHGPFCHVFEMFCKRNPDYVDWTHEKWGKRLIEGKNTNGQPLTDKISLQISTYILFLHQRMSRKYPTHVLLELLTPENISKISFGEGPVFSNEVLTKKYLFLKDIITSAFGIDRLDYLRRDAFYTGVKTGDIDIWEIIGNLQIHKHENRCQLYLSPSASIALETIIKVRDAVYRNLYHNKIHRSAQELIIRALLELGETPAQLILLRDDQLLEKFAASEIPFVKEVEERIRYRLLYEALSLGVHEILHVHENKISSYWEQPNGWRSFKGIEEQIGQRVALRSNQKVIYDLEKIPAIKQEDLEGKFIYDPIDSSPKSIIECKKHMEVLYQGDIFDGISKIHAYNDNVSEVFMSFPYDFIADDIERISKLDQSSIDTEVTQLYQKKVKPLFLGFICDILEIEDRLVSDLEKRLNYERKTIHYLKELVLTKRNL